MVAKAIRSLLGIILILLVGFLFFDSALKTPVSELSPDGECLRVLDGEGKIIPNGCKLAKKGKIVTEQRYVAR